LRISWLIVGMKPFTFHRVTLPFPNSREMHEDPGGRYDPPGHWQAPAMFKHPIRLAKPVDGRRGL
jgi:hypothetical protein